MKKYSFRLENVRRVRRLQEEGARAALANANAQVQRAQQAVEAAMLHYSDVATGNHITQGAEAFAQHRYRVELAGQGVIAARHAKAAVVAEAALAHQAWSDAARRVKALDRLDERAREEYTIEFDREIDRQMDEINVGRAGRPVTA